MNKMIIEYKELLKDLWIKLENDEIATDQYHDIHDKWLMENADEELLDYYINLYDGRIKQQYINLKKRLFPHDDD